MFTTPEGVRVRTGYDVDIPTIQKAQGIIEAYVGRSEGDIQKPSDLQALGRATEYQAAYMSKNYETVFEQVSVAQIAGGEQAITYKSGDQSAPWIAPLAVLALRRLSWKTSRSIRTFPLEINNGRVSEWVRD